MPSDEFVLLIFANGRSVTGWTLLNDYESTGPRIGFEDGLDRLPIARDGAIFRIASPDVTATSGEDYVLALEP